MPSFHSSFPCLTFLADAMLGKLARRLRILGYDTAYERNLPDDALVRRTLAEHRWLLTRDGYLAKRRVLRGRHTLLTSDRLDDQLQQLRRDLHLHLALNAETASRCAVCNFLLEAIPKDEAARRVPALVAGQQTEFSRCPVCGRIFWPGTHWTNLCRQLTAIR